MIDSTVEILCTAAEHPAVSDDSLVWHLVTIPSILTGLHDALAQNHVRQAQRFIRELDDYAETFINTDHHTDHDVLNSFGIHLTAAMDDNTIAHVEVIDRIATHARRLAAHVASGEMAAS